MQQEWERRSRTMSAFEMYLRTGKRPQASGIDEGVEVKFNPWHDPDDGRFTFKGQGTHYARGASQPRRSTGIAKGLPGGNDRRSDGTGSPRPQWSNAPKPRPPQSMPSTSAKPRDSVRGWASGEFQGGGGGSFGGGGGGSFGGGGATSSEAWGPATVPPTPARPKASALPVLRRQEIQAPARSMPVQKMPEPAARPVPQRVARTAEIASPRPAKPIQRTEEQFRVVEKNGYRFQIDDAVRAREIEGDLQDVRSQRSRANQAQAGRPDRLASDDGGHYIAVRFNGPSDSFNHFPQDAGINRGTYRVIENGWARELQAGRRVHVKIVPHYAGMSLRPDELDVTWYVDGKRFSRTIPNQKENQNGR